MRYRKKPVVIDAWLYTADEERKPAWLADAIHSSKIKHQGRVGDAGSCLEIKTLEGVMLAFPGDWIIKGVKGEIYPCKPDIFEMTYEQVTEDGT